MRHKWDCWDVSHGKKKKPCISLQLALDYFPFPSFQSHPLLIAFTLLVIHIGPSFSWNVPRGSWPSVNSPPRHIDSFDGLAPLYKNIPPHPSSFLFKWERLWRGAHRANQCTNLNNLSPAARVSNTVSGRDYTVSVLFFFFFPQLAKAAGRMVKIDHCIRVGGGSPHALLASTETNQMVGTYGRESDKRWHAL